MNRRPCDPSNGTPWAQGGRRWRSGRYRYGPHRARVRFFRRAGLMAVVLLGLALWGLFAAASTIARRIGFGGGFAAVPVLLVVFAAAIGVAAMFGAMRRFAAPLGAVMDAADRVADGDYTVRVDEHGPPPIRALAGSFNTMTERLQNADRLRRDLMADVAHELRTPLSVLQGRLEGLLDGVYARDDAQLSQLLEETHVLSRLVEDLRTLALSEAGALQLQREPIDLVDLARDTAASLHGEAARVPVRVAVSGPPDGHIVEVDPVRIREVLTNLLSNALRHSTAGGSVTVTVTRTEDGVAVAVADTGEGMPPEAVERIFDRFYKGPTSHGSGLGLTIAKGIVVAHGGHISATSRPGTGTTVTFTLPALRGDEQA